MDDKALWEALRKGQADALHQLYERFYYDLTRFGMLHSHGSSEVKDAINQLFLEIWEKRQTLPTVENIKSYLFTYLRRKLIREYKLGNQYTEVPEGDWPSTISYEQYLIDQQTEEHLRQKLTQYLSELSPRQRELIRMRFFEGLSNEAIAQATGMHINTVYNTLYSALKHLRQSFADTDKDSPSLFLILLGLLGTAYHTL